VNSGSTDSPICRSLRASQCWKFSVHISAFCGAKIRHGTPIVTQYYIILYPPQVIGYVNSRRALDNMSTGAILRETVDIRFWLWLIVPEDEDGASSGPLVRRAGMPSDNTRLEFRDK